MSWLSCVYVPIAMAIIKLLVYFVEYVTFPVYNLFRNTSSFMNFPEDESYYQKFNAGQSRVLSMPIVEGDPSSPWRATEYLDSLVSTALPGCQTLSELWLRTVRLWPQKKAFGTRKILKTDYEVQPNGRKMIKLTLGDYAWETYSDAEKRVSQLSAGLHGLLGPEKKTSSPFVIFSETRCEWLYAAQAAFRLNHPIATLYATLGDEAIIHGLEQTEATLVFTSDELLYKIVHLLKCCPKVQYVVYFSNGIFQIQSGVHVGDLNRLNETARQSVELARKEVPEGVKLFDIVELEQRGKKIIERTAGKGKKKQKNAFYNWSPPLQQQANADDLAVIMYTSGSTGQPKGVELSHRNLTSSVAGYFRRIPKLHMEEDIYVGYLPLAHVLELVCETCILIMGIRIGYSNPQTLTDLSSRVNHRTCKGDITLLKPTLFVTVPTVLERVSKTVWEKLREGGPLLEEIFRFAFEFKRRRLQTGFPSFLVDLLIFRRVRTLMGGRIRYIVCGGAPLSEESQIFANVCFAYVMQGYGLTETCAASTLMEVGDLRCHHVGAPTPSIQMKLREWSEGGYSPFDKPFPRGEILISGGSVSRGYFKNEEETEKAFFIDSNGVRWFCTGDIGMVHADGCFSIIDRKKDLVKLQGGEYVSLIKVELALSQSIYVENICVYADPLQNFTVCFVSPKLSQIHKLAGELGILKATEEEVRATFPPERLQDDSAISRAEHGILCSNQKITKYVLEDMQSVGRARKLASFEIPQKAYLDADPWLPDSGLVTDAMKIKRFNIKQKFIKELDSMYK